MRCAVLLAGVMAGCATTTPQFDANFGLATREALSAQVADPQACERNAQQSVEGLDGRVAVEVMRRYEKSFSEPVKSENVLSIGLGDSAAGGR